MTESISHQPAPIDLAPGDDLAPGNGSDHSDGCGHCGLRASAAEPLGTAGLATEITTQLSTQLSKVRLYGFRRPATHRPDARPAAQASVRHRVQEPRTDASRRPVPTLVAVAHGSRDPRAVHTVRALLDRVRALRPDLPVRLGHVELNRPLLADTLAGLRGEVILVPLLFGRGYHVTHDLPAALAAAPHLTGRIARPLGPHALLAEALHGRLLEAGFGDGPGTPAEYGTSTSPRSRSGIGRTAVVLAAAGSRSARSADDTARTAQLLSARLGGIPVLPAFASAAAPTVADAVRILTARGHDRIAVASCFTAPGRFASQCAADAPGIAAAPLGDHPALARLVLHRYDQALFARTASDPDGIRAATVAV